jgi:hypothetical protein
MQFVADSRKRMRALVEKIREAGRFEHVVHIGIGGSHLGPALALDVLDSAMIADGPQVHFVSTPDPAPLGDRRRFKLFIMPTPVNSIAHSRYIDGSMTNCCAHGSDPNLARRINRNCRMKPITSFHNRSYATRLYSGHLAMRPLHTGGPKWLRVSDAGHARGAWRWGRRPKALQERTRGMAGAVFDAMGI